MEMNLEIEDIIMDKYMIMKMEVIIRLIDIV
jgi:hypothetical protein